MCGTLLTFHLTINYIVANSEPGFKQKNNIFPVLTVKVQAEYQAIWLQVRYRYVHWTPACTFASAESYNVNIFLHGRAVFCVDRMWAWLKARMARLAAVVCFAHLLHFFASTWLLCPYFNECHYAHHYALSGSTGDLSNRWRERLWRRPAVIITQTVLLHAMVLFWSGSFCKRVRLVPNLLWYWEK